MLHPTMRSIAEYVVSAYSFLIPLGRTVTGAEYAEAIERVFDTANPAIRCDAEVSRRYIVRVTRGHGEAVRAVFSDGKEASND